MAIIESIVDGQDATSMHEEESRSSPLKEDVQLAREGDREAFGRLYSAYYRRVFGICMLRLRNYTDAEDLTSEVFIRARENIHHLRDANAFGGWIATTAHRMAINFLNRGNCRHSRRTVSYSQDPAGDESSVLIDKPPSPSVMQTETELLLIMRESMQQLCAMDQRALNDFYMKGEMLRESAKKLKTPIGTIKRRLHTARNRLGTLLREHPEFFDDQSV